MKHLQIMALPIVALSILLGACDQKTETPSSTPESEASDDMSANDEAEPAVVASMAANARDNVLTLGGLADLRVGEPIPANSTWAIRGAQVNDACLTASSSQYPGAYAIITGGNVRRITIGERSDVKVVEGVGVGATESDVKKWFVGVREEPHKYIASPAKYLTAPNAASGNNASVRFEIGADRRVGLIHVGTMPELALVEGCS